MVRWWFRLRIVDPVEELEGPCLVTANHSALGVADLLVVLYVRALPLVPAGAVAVAHRLLIGRFGPLTRLVGALGGVAGDRETARRQLREGRLVLVYPGGGFDSCRPVWWGHQLDWRGRHGFARLALEEGVPIRPLVIHGAHLTYWIVGRVGLPRWLTSLVDDRPHQLRITVRGLCAVLGLAAAGAGMVPWWVPAALSVLAVIPLPVRVTLEFLPTVLPEEQPPVELADRVRRSIEGALARGAPRDSRRSRRPGQ